MIISLITPKYSDIDYNQSTIAWKINIYTILMILMYQDNAINSHRAVMMIKYKLEY